MLLGYGADHRTSRAEENFRNSRKPPYAPKIHKRHIPRDAALVR